MKTSEPISTIVYNDPEWLIARLRELQGGDKPLVQEWNVIFHQPEDDEAGTKFHGHLWILPARPIDMASFRDFFVEPDPLNDKPIRPLPFRRTKQFRDWLLYVLHDEFYLSQKLQSRKYHYKLTDIITSNEDYLRTLAYEAQYTDASDSMINRLRTAYNLDMTFQDVLASGLCKPHEVYGAHYIWQAILKNARGELDRNGRKGHEPNPVPQVDLSGKGIGEAPVATKATEDDLRRF